jgi:hypothetical protein
MDYFENLYSNKLENPEEMDKFLVTYEQSNLKQEDFIFSLYELLTFLVHSILISPLFFLLLLILWLFLFVISYYYTSMSGFFMLWLLLLFVFFFLNGAADKPGTSSAVSECFATKLHF